MELLAYAAYAFIIGFGIGTLIFNILRGKRELERIQNARKTERKD